MVDVILDIDSAGDDILAVLYGAFHSRINLLAVTTSCGASGSIEAGLLGCPQHLGNCRAYGNSCLQRRAGAA